MNFWTFPLSFQSFSLILSASFLPTLARLNIIHPFDSVVISPHNVVFILQTQSTVSLKWEKKMFIYWSLEKRYFLRRVLMLFFCWLRVIFFIALRPWNDWKWRDEYLLKGTRHFKISNKLQKISLSMLQCHRMCSEIKVNSLKRIAMIFCVFSLSQIFTNLCLSLPCSPKKKEKIFLTCSRKLLHRKKYVVLSCSSQLNL